MIIIKVNNEMKMNSKKNQKLWNEDRIKWYLPLKKQRVKLWRKEGEGMTNGKVSK